jgi:protein arginine kinase
MSLRRLGDYAGDWFAGQAPGSEVVISSRVRLARNLAGFAFVNRCSAQERRDVMDKTQAAFLESPLAGVMKWSDLTSVAELDRQLLVERHLISRQHGQVTPEQPRAVMVGGDECSSVMVNEEDHFRIQVIRPGLQLNEVFELVNMIDDALDEKVQYAFSQKYGYLTACQTNVGTGIRVSVMLHLPGLKVTGEIEKVKRAARDMHLAVRGMFGEGSEALGDLYQISNQTTLGRSEEEILRDFAESIVPKIIAYEQQARQAIAKQRPVILDDKVWRAWGTLSHARLLGTEEALAQLSMLRLGIYAGVIKDLDLDAVNQLFMLIQPAHLQKVTGRPMEPATRREERARFIRQRLAR